MPRIDAALASIVTELSNVEVVQVCGPGFSSGSAGIAVFFSYLAAAEPGPRWSSYAAHYLQHAATGVAAVRHLPGLFAGGTGIAWTVEHLSQLGLQVGCDPRDETDLRLLHTLESGPWKSDFDLIRGLAGFGVYALERLPHPHGLLLLDRVIERLAERATHLPDGISWFTGPELLGASRSEHPSGYYNLGLAHGLAGVISVLALAATAHGRQQHAITLLEQAVTWLLAQRHEDDSLWCFPMNLSGNPLITRSRRSRLAWCNGDLGIAAALYLAATTLNVPAWESAALDVARKAAQHPPEHAGVVDAGLCHGASGNGHIFNRFYQATREPVFGVASRYWFDQTLRYYRPGQGLGAFRAWRSTRPANDQWVWLPGLLEGVAGVGLALLAAKTTIAPDWDRTLQVTIAPRASS